jgi:hypothetical protein
MTSTDLFQVTSTDLELPMPIQCKRIIDGKTYNTETATLHAGIENYQGTFSYGAILYQTRFGAFFLYRYNGNQDEDAYEIIEPYTPEQAREWLEKNASYQPELIERLFGEMPEGGSGEVRYTLRMPESLRDRLAAHSKANNQSLNAWIIRCLERCASSSEAV